MTHRLKQRQEKIQEKRKKTSWKDFLMEIASYQPVMLYKNQGFTSRYPDTKRTTKIVSASQYASQREAMPHRENSHTEFFSQYKDLADLVPEANVLHDYVNESADYSDICYGAKNAYLSFSVGDNAENIMYSNTVNSQVANIIDSFQVYKNCDTVVSSTYITESSSIFYSKNIHSSYSVRFSNDCIGCNNLLFCSGLVNQSYCIENVQYTKESFANKKQEILAQKEQYHNRKQRKCTYPNIQAGESKGIGLINCSNIQNGYFVKACNNGKNICIVDGTDQSEDLYDCFSIGLNCFHCYGFILGGMNCDHIYCSINIGTSSNIFYSNFLNNCSFCLGCVGLKNKSYCIFNKQYTKDERYDEVDTIFAKMDKTPSNSPLSGGGSQLGEFFPGSMNPFYFNDTAAYLIDPSFKKEEVTAKGYLRRDEPIKVDIPSDATVIKSTDLSQYESYDEAGNWKIDADILKVVIQDEQDNYYRIIPMEYKFLVKHGLPLPRKHWLERMKDNFKIE